MIAVGPAKSAGGVMGAMLGVALGGVVAVRWGWRAAFVVVALPGLAVALLFLRFRDYPRVRLDGSTGARSARRAVLALVSVCGRRASLWVPETRRTSRDLLILVE
jgi:predicted MFS family arabinose efflux permease